MENIVQTDNIEIILLNRTQISDLFFNFEKPHLQELDKKYENMFDGLGNLVAELEGGYNHYDQQYMIDYTNALTEDAKSFLEIIGDQIDIEWLLIDYSNRV